tara:strand:- start:2969 stop:3706 length:738 start_codon:yes stop_codon:yes gene_type:complete
MAQRSLLLARCLLLLGCLSWLLPAHGWSFFKDRSGTHVPAVGKLLVAMPSLTSPHFGGTVILLVRYSRGGALGLIINRPTRITLAAEYSNQINERHGDEALFWGGPVAMHRRVMLVENPALDKKLAEQEGAVERLLEPVLEQNLGGLYLINNRALFQRLLLDDQLHSRMRVFAGYSGWGPSQLEREIIRGDWLVLPGGVELVMQSDPESIWSQLIHQQRGQMVIYKPNPTSTQPAQRSLLTASGH